MIVFDRIQIMAQFGKASLAVGCNKAGDFWYVSIRNLKKDASVGDVIEQEDLVNNSDAIILTFPSENQMIKVMAAFTNKTFEQVLDKWLAKKDEVNENS